MPLRRRRPTEEQIRRAEESVAALEAGGIPVAAAERLEEFRHAGGRFFTSDLSVNELMLTRQAGFRPLTQVMGTCFYRAGWQAYPWGSAAGWGGMSWGSSRGETLELEQPTSAWNEARRIAVSRLGEEARRAGADVVAGVRLRRRHHEWATGLIEFIVVGTAMRSERLRIDDAPVLSNLSGQDLNKLVRHGFWPVGLVAGTTVAYVATGTQQQYGSTGLFSSMRNQEMPDFTRGIYDARELAMRRLTEQARALHAHRVVGVTVERSQREIERDRGGGTRYTDLVIEMNVLGTAIVEVEHDEDAPPTRLVLELNDPRETT